MSEWLNSQQKPSSKFRELLQERIDKANPRCELTTEESKRLAKLDAIATNLSAEKTCKTASYKLGLAKMNTHRLKQSGKNS